MFDPDSSPYRLRNTIALGCALLTLSLTARAAEPSGSPLLNSRQLIVVTTADWDTVSGTLHRYQREAPGKPWQRVGDPVEVVVGKAGMGWGDGLTSIPARASGDPVKHEGDGKSPAGIFRLGTAFGYAPEKPANWTMPYRPLTPATECVDDTHSQHYNQIVERTGTTPDWNSSEHMRSEGIYYEWGAVIEQNAAARPGDGSCVFLHISDGGHGGTSGCTAMAKPQIEAVLEWLDPKDEPLLVEMPLKKYRQAEKSLHLPSE